MRNQPIDIGTMVIAENGTDSSEINFENKPLRGITIFGPAELTGTAKVQVSKAKTGDDWHDLQIIAGTDLEVGAANAVYVDTVCWKRMRIKSGSSEAAARTFTVLGCEDIT